MEVIHINDSNDSKKMVTVRKKIKEGKDVFVLVYMVNCGACDIVHPEWNKIKQEAQAQKANDLLDNPNIVLVDMNEKLLQHPSNSFIKEETIIGFPTVLFLGKNQRDELKASLPNAKTLVEWIQKKSSREKNSSSFQKGGRKTKKRRLQKGKKTKRGGKWSLKYKRSINCRRPRGFSQRQHCKYGRKE